MKHRLTVFLTGILFVCLPIFSTNLPHEDFTITGINRESGRATFWYYTNKENALKSGYLNAPDNICLNGKWKFSFAENPSKREKEFYKKEYDVSAWKEIDVPSSWQRQGYDKALYMNHPYEFNVKAPFPPKVPTEWNPVGSYRREFSIPSDWDGKRIILHFGAVKSSFYVWINGEKVGYSQDSKMQAEFDITPYIKPGVKNDIAVEVYRFSIGSYLECQDFWRLAGIKRDVWIYATPKTFIKDFWVKSTLTNNYKNGYLDLNVKLQNKQNKSQKSQLKIELFSEQGKLIFDTLQQISVKKNIEKEIHISKVLPNVKEWNSESPVLYTLLLSSTVDGVTTYSSSKIGFRTVEINDGLLQVNGKTIRVKGVNRHEHHPVLGHYIPPATTELDIEMMRKLNINAIRTCHYPADPYLYELCDKYGLYMVDEANVESHGLGAALQAPYDNNKHIADNIAWEPLHYDRMERMVQRDKNHPSVIIWSMGNECGDGIVFRTAYKKLKELDKTRLVQFEQAGTQSHTDIYCPMYMKMDKMENYALSYDKYRPLILCEYAHSMGNSLGNFQDYWDLIDKYPTLQGGFIWDWVDEGMLTERNGEKFFDYGGAFGLENERNDGPFCLNGLVNPDRKCNPHAWEAKKVLQDIKISSTKRKTDFVVENKFSFTNLNEYTMKWRIEENGKKVKSGTKTIDVAPGEIKIISLPIDEMVASRNESFITIEFVTNKEDRLLPSGYSIAYEQLKLNNVTGIVPQMEKKGAISTKEEANAILVKGNKFEYHISKDNGRITSLKYNNYEYMDGENRYDFYRVPVDNDGWDTEAKYWKSPKSDVMSVKTIPSKDSVTIQVSTIITADKALRLTANMETEYTIYPDGTIQVKHYFVPEYYHSEKESAIPRLGELFTFKGDMDNIKWYGRGPWENYADRKTSALVSLYESPLSEMNHEYIRPQENGYRTDVRWISAENNTGNGIRFIGKPLICFNAQQVESADFEKDGKPIRNTIDLHKKNKLFLNIDYGQKGIGGDNSWGFPVHLQYRVVMRAYNYSYFIQPF